MSSSMVSSGPPLPAVHPLPLHWLVYKWLSRLLLPAAWCSGVSSQILFLSRHSVPSSVANTQVVKLQLFFLIKEEGAFSSLFAYSHYFIEGCRLNFKSYFCSCICLLESFSLTPPVPSCWDYRCGPCLSKPRAEHCVLVFTQGVQILCQLSYTLSEL